MSAETEQNAFWRHRLDTTINHVSVQLREDLYDNIVVPIVQDWFACSDSITDLNTKIHTGLKEAWPRAQRKIESAFLEFVENLKVDLHRGELAGRSAQLRTKEAETQISSVVANVIGSILTVISGTLLGGAGTALLLEGPVGWVIGAVLAATAYIFGKKKIEGFIKSAMRNRKIFPLLKRPAKTKVATELKLNAPKFEEEMFQLLKQQATPLYEELEKLHE